VANPNICRPRIRDPFKAGPILVGHLALVCTLALAATAWGGVLIAGPQDHQIETFLIVLGVYGTASAAFIGSRMRSGQFRFFDLPIFVTILAFVDFGLAPLGCFLTGVELDPSFHGDYQPFIHALALVVLGMMAFWAGAHVFAQERPTSEKPAATSERAVASPPIDRVVVWAVISYCGAFLLKAYFLQNFGFGYGASEQVYFKHLAAVQVANLIFQLGTYALVILAIERSFHPFSLERKVLFWVIFVPECFWGLLSGMKSTLLQNFVLVAIVSSLAERKLKKGWVIAAFLGLVLMYPFSMRYRDLVRGRSREGMDLSGAAQISSLAFDEATRDDSTPVGWLGSGASATLSRLNLLQSFALVMSLGPRADLLKGDERWWMLPVYPFVPRFLWPTKPILDKARRFSVALGYGDQTSTALTYPGDLLLEYGLPGLLVGMLLFGLVAQWLTNRFRVPGSKRCLFVYTGMFISVLFAFELDTFDFWCTLIRNLVILGAVAWLLYRDSRSKRRSTA
jgi:hypothetical protein